MGLKHSILGLLNYKPMHGYRLKEHLERNFGHMWSINYGQIYPNLKKMHNDGLITMNEARSSVNTTVTSIERFAEEFARAFNA